MHVRQVQSSPANAPRSSQAHQGWTQQNHRQVSSQPFHCQVKRHVLLDWQLSSQASVESLSFSSHPTRGRKNNGGKGAELNLSHSLAILAFLFLLEALVQGWHSCWKIAGAVRVKYPDIDERVVPPNTKMEHRTLAWVLVINERAWFYSVHIDSSQGHRPWSRRDIDVLGIDLFHCECLQYRGVKPENSADEACFHSFYIFRWIVKFISRARCAPRARKNSKKNHLTDKVSSSTSVIVLSLVAQLKV